jgi:hypothetical protein
MAGMRVAHIRDEDTGREVEIAVAVDIVNPDILSMIPNERDLIRHAWRFMLSGKREEFCRFRSRYVVLFEMHVRAGKMNFTL